MFIELSAGMLPEQTQQSTQTYHLLPEAKARFPDHTAS